MSLMQSLNCADQLEARILQENAYSDRMLIAVVLHYAVVLAD